MLKMRWQFLGFIFLMFMFAGCGKHVVKMDPIVYKENSAKVVFYRGNDAFSQPVTVAIQDSIVGVLKHNQYLEASVCEGKFPAHAIARMEGNASRNSVMLDVVNSETIYIRLDITSDGFQPIVVKPIESEDITKGQDRGTYAINRYTPSCINTIDISADVLFAFNSSVLSNKGNDVLEEIADSLKLRAVELETIIIEGHTDRIGSNAYNDKLSLDRANSVIDYLKSHGVMTPISPRPMGKRMPITDGCHGVVPKLKLQECLSPDRRVRIELIGKSHKIVDKGE